MFGKESFLVRTPHHHIFHVKRGMRVSTEIGLCESALESLETESFIVFIHVSIISIIILLYKLPTAAFSY